ncbi:M20/M25/M40 family metallo-hydrolase [Exiguobacterium artemiae]|uniref:M20/M25/M40 family metallo-hydrolase n=1 Tax=Exiguobacterium artemiae TaxID=340145 RepID=UPI0004790913|nr:M20/M25/M40 family metallo-hydrolase [Exiguobacterium sibiricum]
MTNATILLARHGLSRDDQFNKTHVACLTDSILQYPVVDWNDRQLIEWIQQVPFENLPGREAMIDPSTNDLPYQSFDPYIRGIVRWLNALDIPTLSCCDGHGRGRASILLKRAPSLEQWQLLQLALPYQMTMGLTQLTLHLDYRKSGFSSLLSLAERLYRLTEDRTYVETLRLEQFKHRLLTWLDIPGVSKRERLVAMHLRNHLRSSTDFLYTDKQGNVLATIQYGVGPTVLLSAHMDTVELIEEGRVILEDGTNLRSSSGILGADDRAGITAILEVLDRVQNTNFSGTLKLAFTVQEEIGCRGAEGIDPDFLHDVDATIVVDRRGTRDIVTACRNQIPFCTQEFGQLFEEAGCLAGMTDWQTTTNGGSSDAKVFAGFGIPSVNLSVGYMHEHTEHETVDYAATFETVTLIESVLHHQLIPVLS